MNTRTMQRMTVLAGLACSVLLASAVRGDTAINAASFDEADGRAHATTTRCIPIKSIPATLSTSGNYCLTRSLTATTPLPSFAAIKIEANNVNLDLNGFRLSGTGAADSHDMGVLCDQCAHVTVKNGTITGFDTAVRLGADLPSQSRANVIENLRVVANTRLGIAGVGSGNLVRNNLIVQTGGSNFSTESNGIVVQGIGIRVLNNDIASTRQPGGAGVGIEIITGNSFPRPAANLAINNRITDSDIGIRYFESEGKYRDNVTSNVTTPYIGGTDIGNNF